jgi:hypothetical protein
LKKGSGSTKNHRPAKKECNLFDYKVDHNEFFERLRKINAYYTRRAGERSENPGKNPVLK